MRVGRMFQRPPTPVPRRRFVRHAAPDDIPDSQLRADGRKHLLMLQDGYKQRVEASFDARTTYDEKNTFHSRLAEELLSRTPLRPGDRVLDVACGTGMVALPAARMVAPGGGCVVGVDLSAGMLEQAARKAAHEYADLPPGALQLLRQDVDAASFPDGSFDAVTCSAATPFLHDTRASLRSWRRWLRPGSGCLVFNAFAAPTTPEFGILLRLLREQCGIELEDPCARLGSEQLCRQELQRAGYEQVQVWRIEFEDRLNRPPAAFVEGIWRQAANSPFAPLETLLSAEALQRLQQEFVAAATPVAAARAVDGGAAVRNTTVAFVARGRRPATG